MGKTNKSPIAASLEQNDNIAGDAVPAPRKRGRPRKVQAEQTAKDKKTEEPFTDAVKKPRGVSFKEEADESVRNDPHNMAGSWDIGQIGGKAIITEDGLTSKKPLPALHQSRREGNRRKSEPRRAAESLIQSR